MAAEGETARWKEEFKTIRSAKNTEIREWTERAGTAEECIVRIEAEHKLLRGANERLDQAIRE